ncbi:hypothetical protein ACWCPF_11360 [Streptomyces sp. NPDC001858]
MMLPQPIALHGCGYTGVFWRIFPPQSWPVFSVSPVIAFTWMWGDCIAPQLLLSADRSTLAVAAMSTYVNPAGTPPPASGPQPR